MSVAAFTETVLRRDRSVVLAGLVSIVLLSWAYIIYLARDMANMMNMSNANLGMGMAMPAIQPWGAVDYLLMFIMWSARRLLRRLLLADDGLAPSGRCHEPVLDRRHRRLCPGREVIADHFKIEDENLKREVNGRCGFATDFAYSS